MAHEIRNHQIDGADLVFRENDWLTVGNLWNTTVLQGVLAEALTLTPSASKMVTEVYEAGDGRVSSRRCHSYAYPGRALAALHDDPDLRQYLSTLSSSSVFPTRASYVIYQPGEFIGMHTDIPWCAISVLIPVTPDAGPLHIQPALRGASQERLLDVAQTSKSFPSGGLTPTFPANGALLFRGSRLPHYRPPCPDLTIMAAMCYDAVDF